MVPYLFFREPQRAVPIRQVFPRRRAPSTPGRRALKGLKSLNCEFLPLALGPALPSIQVAAPAANDSQVGLLSFEILSADVNQRRDNCNQSGDFSNRRNRLTVHNEYLNIGR
jgi:hypothetical protein